jgi:HD-like signal output (HDOD) protein/ActR/RegA family two-component response regulator
MSTGPHRALVVDQDPAVQRLTVAALATHGFACDAADNAEQAFEKLAAASYVVAIVDLKIATPAGKPLALELADLSIRPLVVVHTDVIDPKLGHDLIERGVDGVMFKPIDVAALAAKVRSVIEDRRPLPDESAQVAGPGERKPTLPASEHRVSLAQLNEKLREVSSVLPISTSALDVYVMTQNLEWDLSQIAAAVQRDASLTTEVLRMANSAYFNPPGRHIVELEEAVMRIGQKHVGELAISVNALSTVTPAKVPWLDLELSWNRSMAAGIALELLVDQGGHAEVADGLFLSAIMHPLGRIVLGMLFPKQYAKMIEACSRSGAALEEVERQMFPSTHTDVMAQLLADWKIAPEVFVPLQFSLDEYAALVRLLEPMRTKALLVKVAIFLGRLAIGRWESWDFVRFPPNAVLERLRIRNVEQLVEQIRVDVDQLAGFHPDAGPGPKKTVRKIERHPVAYGSFSDQPTDLVKEFLPALGVDLQLHSTNDLQLFDEPLMANCIGVDPAHFAAPHASNLALILTDESNRESFSRIAPTIGLPNSFQRLQEKLRTTVIEKAPEPVIG